MLHIYLSPPLSTPTSIHLPPLSTPTSIHPHLYLPSTSIYPHLYPPPNSIHPHLYPPHPFQPSPSPNSWDDNSATSTTDYRRGHYDLTPTASDTGGGTSSGDTTTTPTAPGSYACHRLDKLTEISERYKKKEEEIRARLATSKRPSPPPLSAESSALHLGGSSSDAVSSASSSAYYDYSAVARQRHPTPPAIDPPTPLEDLADSTAYRGNTGAWQSDYAFSQPSHHRGGGGVGVAPDQYVHLYSVSETTNYMDPCTAPTPDPIHPTPAMVDCAPQRQVDRSTLDELIASAVSRHSNHEEILHMEDRTRDWFVIRRDTQGGGGESREFYMHRMCVFYSGQNVAFYFLKLAVFSSIEQYLTFNPYGVLKA